MDKQYKHELWQEGGDALHLPLSRHFILLSPTSR